MLGFMLEHDLGIVASCCAQEEAGTAIPLSSSWTSWDTSKLICLSIYSFLFVLTYYKRCPCLRAFVDIFLVAPWRLKLGACLGDVLLFVVPDDDDDDDDYTGEGEEEGDSSSRSNACCPKRRARYWMCAKRRARRRCAATSKEAQGPPPDERDFSDDSPCPLAAFCKMHLPPPLPFMRRRRLYRQLSTHTSAPQQQPSEGIDDDDDETNKPKNAAATQEEVSNVTDESSASSSSLEEDSPPARQNSNAATTPLPPRVTTTTTAHLIDLTRMQQWPSILNKQHELQRKEAKYRDADGLYPLHWAAAGGAPGAVVQALLDTYPAAARRCDAEGSFALHFAAHYGSKCVELLLRAHPAAAHKLDAYGRSPLFHAVEKQQQPLEVIQLLVRAEPAMMVTPCYGPAERRRRLQDHHHVSRSSSKKKSSKAVAFADNLPDPSTVSREAAVRTPLYLAWAQVLSDRQTRTLRRGKKWDKAVWMLQTAFHLTHNNRHDHLLPSSPNKSHSSSSHDMVPVLQASVAMDVYLPDKVLSLLVAAYSEQLRIPNALGQLPLAAAVSSTVYLLARQKAVVEVLLEAHPAAAHHRNPETGRSALHEAILAGHQLTAPAATSDGSTPTAASASVLERLLRAAPESIEWKDLENGLPPALLAAMPRKHVACIASDTTSETTSAKLVDPFNILSSKQHELIHRTKVDGSIEAAAPCTEQDTETAQLETIYALLRMNPAQLVTSD